MRHTAALIDPPAQTSGIFRSLTTGMTRVIAILMLALALLGPSVASVMAQSTPVPAASASPVAESGIDAAVSWLIAQQDPSGGFIGFSGEPDAGTTVDAVLALASVLEPTNAALTAATDFLIENGDEYAQFGPGQAAKLLMAYLAVGQPIDESGLVESIVGSIPAETDLAEGQLPYCGYGPFDHALCIIALVAADAEIPGGMVETLIASQIENGGWAFDGSSDPAMSDSNTTAIAIQALMAAGVDPSDESIQAGLTYLQTVIDPEQGGFAYDANSGLIADANSTAVVIQALIAVGEDPASDEWGQASDALNGFQNASGAFRYQHEFPDDSLYATLQAIPALAGTPFPLAPR